MVVKESILIVYFNLLYLFSPHFEELIPSVIPRIFTIKISSIKSC